MWLPWNCTWAAVAPEATPAVGWVPPAAPGLLNTLSASAPFTCPVADASADTFELVIICDWPLITISVNSSARLLLLPLCRIVDWLLVAEELDGWVPAVALDSSVLEGGLLIELGGFELPYWLELDMLLPEVPSWLELVRAEVCTRRP